MDFDPNNIPTTKFDHVNSANILAVVQDKKTNINDGVIQISNGVAFYMRSGRILAFGKRKRYIYHSYTPTCLSYLESLIIGSYRFGASHTLSHSHNSLQKVELNISSRQELSTLVHQIISNGSYTTKRRILPDKIILKPFLCS